mmetsp:Transcript_86685/g.240391  ORF Transcript_86685/g.240391 Transcript_86685/m.240391 type:complete len:334 (+) Transcript_86685:542-1543(+)
MPHVPPDLPGHPDGSDWGARSERDQAQRDHGVCHEHGCQPVVDLLLLKVAQEDNLQPKQGLLQDHRCAKGPVRDHTHWAARECEEDAASVCCNPEDRRNENGHHELFGGDTAPHVPLDPLERLVHGAPEEAGVVEVVAQLDHVLANPGGRSPDSALGTLRKARGAEPVSCGRPRPPHHLLRMMALMVVCVVQLQQDQPEAPEDEVRGHAEVEDVREDKRHDDLPHEGIDGNGCQVIGTGVALAHVVLKELVVSVGVKDRHGPIDRPVAHKHRITASAGVAVGAFEEEDARLESQSKRPQVQRERDPPQVVARVETPARRGDCAQHHADDAQHD